jgi:hypothetical protein
VSATSNASGARSSSARISAASIESTVDGPDTPAPPAESHSAADLRQQPELLCAQHRDALDRLDELLADSG